ncbi:hypothetical protein Glove_141g65 [Diversispora epigaea]|uniref:Protein kinase domain-containing protein n=1 Tax=Diversispora epigaea TaxID=1348612 RepID=A0A397IUV2_9GLOM|nr:hypothetical protein Glove_141g65 [Diversispora epigaea]
MQGGYIGKWNIENKQWKRYREGVEVALKNFDNFVNFNDVLNEMEIHRKTNKEYYYASIQFYGITQDLIYDVFRICKRWNLREYLKINFNNINWNQKLNNFGLSKLMGSNPNNPEKKNIFGVLPYIAPEVLSGDEEYTKAADVYSYGIIAYKMVTGFPPYPDISHDKDLAMKICNGLRTTFA